MTTIADSPADSRIAILTDNQVSTDHLHTSGGFDLLKDQVFTLPTGVGKMEAAIKFVQREKNIIVWISAASLPQVAPAVSEAANRHRLAGLLVQDDDAAWFPQLLRRANLRTLRNTFSHGTTETDVPRRVLRAWLMGAEHELIANARIVDSTLLVLTCAFDIVEVPFDAHPALARIPEIDRSKFIVSDDGSLITWDTDPYPTDLDLSALRYAADPAFRENVDRERQLRGAAYGHVIRAFREEKGIRQSDIAGLSERQVRRIEREGTTSENALKALAAAHKFALGDYLNELAERAQNK